MLLAKDLNGYQNLIKLISAPFETEAPALAIISIETVRKYKEGLIAMSACALGEFGKLVSDFVADRQVPEAFANAIQDNSESYQKLAQHVTIMRELFPDSFYVELIDNNLPEQRRLLPALVAAAQHFKLPTVASGDAHYLKADDAESHAVLMAIKNDMTLRDLSRRRQDVRFHVLSNEEVEAVYGAWPEAMANTLAIAEQCNLQFKFGQFYLPKFPVAPGETLEDAMEKLTWIGLDDRLAKLRPLYGERLNAELEEHYRERLRYELSIIRPMKFAGYFLIVQDFINWAKQQGIPVGPGRGSGAGSLVAYSLRITDLDPIENGLVFERFLNPERISMPDFDVDFCQDRRDEVIRYVIDKYGASNVAQITTFGKMLAKAAIRDVGRALELGYKRCDKIAKLIPNELGITLDDAISKEPRLGEEASADAVVADLLGFARKLEGLTRHSSVHAAGLVISDGPMVDYVPVYRTEGTGLITQYEMSHVEKVGLVKFDFLGLKTLTVIDRAVKIIHHLHDPDFSIETIPLDAKQVYKDISSAHTTGIFQLESTGMQQLVAKLQPNQFGDLVALVALFRPGPLGSGMVEDFIERKHGRAPIKYLLPQLEGILKETYGIVLYQEQVMQTAATLASYSLGEADLLRRAMGKKKPEEMAKQKSRFVDGSVKNGIPSERADEIFELLAKFAEYGFNKSHSAAYGLVSYQTAYLKTFYPAEYMAAIMTCDADNTDKIARYAEECRRLSLSLLPPSINHSTVEFSVPGGKAVRFGLGAIKGVGPSSLANLLAERDRNGTFTSMEDLAERVDLRKVGKKTMELLAQAGALDCFGLGRQKTIDGVDAAVRQSESLHGSQGQKTLFGLAPKSKKNRMAPDDNASKISESGSSGAQADSSLSMELLLAERKVLGVFLTAHPLDLFPQDMATFGRTRLKSIPNLEGKGKIAIPAFLAGIEERLSKKGHRLVFARLEDQETSIEALLSTRDGPPQYPPINTAVIMVGQVDKGYEPGTTRLRIERILPLEAVRRERVRRLTINLNTSGSETGNSESTANDRPTSALPSETLMSMRSALLDHPGKTAVQFRVRSESCEVAIEAEGFAIEMSDALLSRLRKIAPHLMMTYAT